MNRREIATTLILLAQESGLPVSVDCWHSAVFVRRKGAGLPFAWLETVREGELFRIRLERKRATTKLIEAEGVAMRPYDRSEGAYSLLLDGRVSLPLFRLLARLMEMGFHESVSLLPAHMRGWEGQ